MPWQHWQESWKCCFGLHEHNRSTLVGNPWPLPSKNPALAVLVSMVASHSTCSLHTGIEIPRISRHRPQKLAAQFKTPYRIERRLVPALVECYAPSLCKGLGHVQIDFDSDKPFL